MTCKAWCTLLLAAALAGGGGGLCRHAENVAAEGGGRLRARQAAPVFRLSPASLGKDLAVQQQLSVTTRGETQRVDVLLEVDATAVRLALVTMGQTAARLEWDGHKLSETRAPSAARRGVRRTHPERPAARDVARGRGAGGAALPAGSSTRSPAVACCGRGPPTRSMAVTYPSA